jgi:hypothetical protein
MILIKIDHRHVALLLVKVVFKFEVLTVEKKYQKDREFKTANVYRNEYQNLAASQIQQHQQVHVSNGAHTALFLHQIKFANHSSCVRYAAV